MKKNLYKFDQWINDAFLGVVKQALTTCAQYGLEDGHCFYVTFYTKHSDTVMSDALKLKYPEFITIVLDNIFDDLIIEKDGFYVTLQFNGEANKLYVPFTAIGRFYDPKIELSLTLKYQSTNPSSEISKNTQKSKKLANNIMEFPSDFRKNT